MQIPLTSMEQLLPFPTAQELVAKKREPVESVPPGMTVLEALQLMAEKNIRFLPVIENGKLAGVISERDCARRVILGRLAADSTPVRDIMATDVSTGAAGKQDPGMHHAHVREGRRVSAGDAREGNHRRALDPRTDGRADREARAAAAAAWGGTPDHAVSGPEQLLEPSA